jgi:hypothetical protein
MGQEGSQRRVFNVPPGQVLPVIEQSQLVAMETVLAAGKKQEESQKKAPA